VTLPPGSTTTCAPRLLSGSIKESVRRFYGDEAGQCPCVVTGTEFGPEVDIAHLDDNIRHSYRHNLVPVHPTINRHLGGLKRRYGSPTAIVVPCDFAQLDWENLRRRADLHREEWHSRRAYACARIGYYTITRYYRWGGLGKRYEVMTDCLYFARHVWDEDLIWALLDHDLVPLLYENASKLPRQHIAPLIRQVAALWTDLREPRLANIILTQHDVLLGGLKRDAVDQKTACSLARRRGMDAVSRDGLAGLFQGASFAKEAFSLARTLEEKINALEVLPWLAGNRNDWKRVRGLLEGHPIFSQVLRLVEKFARDLKRQTSRGQLGHVLLKKPAHLTPLNAAQVPMDLAISLLKTDGPSKKTLRKIRKLVNLSNSVHHLWSTRPFMLTENVKGAYRDLANVIREPWLYDLADGRCLSPRTRKTLLIAGKLAMDRFREAKS
jgi:hypothetical protein